MELDPKVIGGIIGSAIIGLAGGGGLGFGYSSEQHTLDIEAEKSKREDIQKLFDSQNAAHERAMRSAQDGYTRSLEILAGTCG